MITEVTIINEVPCAPKKYPFNCSKRYFFPSYVEGRLSDIELRKIKPIIMIIRIELPMLLPIFIGFLVKSFNYLSIKIVNC
jgi:hypothetical protein